MARKLLSGKGASQRKEASQPVPVVRKFPNGKGAPQWESSFPHPSGKEASQCKREESPAEAKLCIEKKLLSWTEGVHVHVQRSAL